MSCMLKYILENPEFQKVMLCHTALLSSQGCFKHNFHRVGVPVEERD